MHPGLNTSALALLPLRLRLRFEGRTPGAAHAAEMWRGAMKHALQTNHPAAFGELHDPESAARERGEAGVPTNTTTPGYTLRVADSGSEAAADAWDQWLHITLFGRAARLAPHVLYALLEGARAGVGGGGLRFKLEELQRRTDAGWLPERVPVPGADLEAWLWRLPEPALGPACASGGVATLMLHFTSRLVLKHPQSAPPGLPQITGLLLERANRLGLRWGQGTVADDAARVHLLRCADAAWPVQGLPPLQHVERTLPGKRIPSSGWSGLLACRLPAKAAHALMPLLRLGNWLHAGEQTTLGAGHYRLLTEVA